MRKNILKRKSNKSCYLCGKRDFKKRPGAVRDDPSLDVMQCLACGLVFLSSFDHIHKDFYSESRMHNNEVGIDRWLQETAGDDERRFDFLRDRIKDRSLLDFGCGAGGFLMRAKQLASYAAGIEPDRCLKEHFEREKIIAFPSLENIRKRFDVITAFHVIEHIADPVCMLKKLSKNLAEGGHMIVEVPNENDALLSLYRNKAFSEFTYWSCHLFLFNESTLSALAKKAGLKINYIKQIQRYPLSNHLYWLAKGKPGGHKEWHYLDSAELNNAYEKQLGAGGCCDTLIGDFSAK